MYEEQLARAIQLRTENKKQASNQLLVQMVMEYPHDAAVNYQCAWSFDVLGEELKAVPYYEKAIKQGLSGADLEGAFLGLGSTYRTLGEYEKSKKILLQGITLFPSNKALQVFYAMTLYNLHEHHKAMELLLQCLVDTTTDAEILSYQKAIHFYATQLDKVWK
ncbi:tetratricopeptide repeat protein [Lysinibacillus sp. NPDC097195]|uniref:tetratricopeptide repeat protein n=1 Tax=Lysinibacillus sp. NPDC097195 TaxID=3364141 RepID=UPI0038169041